MKQKTKKAARKRFSVTGRGKVKRRPVRQAHFNAKDTGKDTRRKHGAEFVDGADLGRLKELLPYA